MISLWIRSSRIRFVFSLGTVLDSRMSYKIFQCFFHPGTTGGSGFGIGVSAQDTLDALAEPVELFLQDFVLSMIGFGGHIADQFIEFVEGEVKHRPLPRLRRDSQAVRQRLVSESVGDDQVAFTLV